MRRSFFALCAMLAFQLTPPAGAANGPAAPTAGERHFAITLVIKSTEPDAEQARAAQAFPGYTIYRTRTDVMGKALHLVRLGFFSSFDEAMAMKTKVLPRFPNARATAISEEEYRGATATRAAKAEPKPAPKPEPQKPRQAAAPKPPTPGVYAVNLASGRKAGLRPARPLPDAVKDRRLYVSSVKRDGAVLYLLNLGFFASKREASEALALLAAAFPAAKVIPVTAAEQKASEKTALPHIPLAPAAAPVPEPRAAAMTPVAFSPVDEQAEKLMARGRDALTAGNNAAAFEAFDRILRLPPNRYTQDAQEYAGLARERAGEIAAAKREYELYLRLYPEGEGAERVRQRLANLAPVQTAAPLKAPKKKRATETSVYGSLSQYYYHGASRIETTTTSATTTTTDTFSNTDQSALVTNVDLVGRYRSERFDNRVVFRDNWTKNFNDIDDRNRLTAAYFETRHRQLDAGVRIGRQPGYTGGVLGRFDGALINYAVLPKFRVDLVAGSPVEILSDLDKKFYGVNLDMGTFAEHWGGATYFISQEVDGILDRQAVGGELRYFDPKRSFFGLMDYDTSYAVLNTAMLQGTWQTAAGTTLNVLADRRKTPAMQTSNALIGESVTTIDALLQTLSEDEIRRYAKARTADASLYLIGAAHPVSAKWQLGGDIRVSDISGTEAVGAVPAMPGTGNIYTYTAQAIGTGLITGRDSTVAALSFINGATYDGTSVSLTNRTLVGANWTYDTALRWYEQEDDFGTELTRFLPTFRVAYRWTERMTLEAELGTERAKTDSATTHENVNRDFFYVGYRWDF